MSLGTWGIGTGGGDCPGLNAALKAVVSYGTARGLSFVGIEDGLSGLLEGGSRCRPLKTGDVAHILERGGTILGSSSRGFAFSGSTREISLRKLKANMELLGLEGLILLGGEGTQGLAWHLHRLGVKVIGIPKTIDNDLPGTDESLGFSTCADLVTESVVRLRSTAESHKRLMVLEVMGRDSGYIALEGGVAGGADVILIPEIPFSMERVLEFMAPRSHGVLVVSEGSHPVGSRPFYKGFGGTLGGISWYVANFLWERLSRDSRCTVLGHLQRGGPPNRRDKILGSHYGVHGVDLILSGRVGSMVIWKNGRPGSLSYDAFEPLVRRQLRLDDPLIYASEALGICLGR